MQREFFHDLKSLDVDVAVCGSYKWVLAPSGVAFLYIKKELLDIVSTNSWTGWIGVRDSVVERMIKGEGKLFERPLPLLDSQPANNTSRYEWGSWAWPTIVRLTESPMFLHEIGLHWSWVRIQNSTMKFIEDLTDKGFKIFPQSRKIGGVV